MTTSTPLTTRNAAASARAVCPALALIALVALAGCGDDAPAKHRQASADAGALIDGPAPAPTAANATTPVPVSAVPPAPPVPPRTPPSEPLPDATAKAVGSAPAAALPSAPVPSVSEPTATATATATVDGGPAPVGDPSTQSERTAAEDPIVAAQARDAAAAAKKVVEERPGAATGDKKDGAADVEILSFETLSSFVYEVPNPDIPESFEKAIASIPPDILSYDGKTVTVEGYMIPLEYAEDDDGVKSFLLSRFQVGCCFGVVPKPNELVEVDMSTGKSAPYVSYMPVTVTGELHVGPTPGAGSALSGIYRMRMPKVTIPVDQGDDGSR